MIVVDSSALVAVVLDEPDRGFLTSILAAATTRICSQVSFVETAMVLTGKTHRLPMSELDAALAVLKVEQVDLDTTQALLAIEAFRRFGRGNHPAKLNFGDCFSYALAKSLNAPLLYKGDDFRQTDIASALTIGAPRP